MKRLFLFNIVVAVLFSSFLCSREKKSLEPAELESSAKDLIESLIKEDYSAVINMFDDKMKMEMPVEKLKQTWQSVIENKGSFQAFGEIRTKEIDEHFDVIVTCEFENFIFDIHTIFNKKKLVSGLFFTLNKAVG